MARQNINVNPAMREFEAYMDFSGGINSETSNERLSDSEFLQMVNVDINTRGSVKKRAGYEFVAQLPLVDDVQGMFFFYRPNKEHPDIIFARGGRLFVKQFDNQNTTATYILINNLPFFQDSRIVEGVQFLNKLYVATGEKLVVVEYINNGWSANVVKPYQPVSQELKFIGKNSLLSFSMENTELPTTATINKDFQAKGIVFGRPAPDFDTVRAGLKGQEMSIQGYVAHKTTNLNYYDPAQNKYNFYYRKTDKDDFKTESYKVPTGATKAVYNLPEGEVYEKGTGSLKVFVDDEERFLGKGFVETSDTSFTITPTATAGQTVRYTWKPSWYKVPYESTTTFNDSYIQTTKYAKTESFGSSYDYFYFTPLEAGLYDFKFEVTFYDKSQNPDAPIVKETIFDGFTVKNVLDKNDVIPPNTGVGIESCNRIRLHFNRLILFGDIDEPTQMYFSHIDNPTYFPVVNMIRFDTGKKEPITTIERIQNYLAIFTKTTIHTLTGVNPSDFVVNLINDSVGCIAPRSAVLTGNVITFLAQDGVHALKPANFKLDQLNVQRVDTKIKGEVLKDVDVCAVAHDSQYYMCYPTRSFLYRYYYEQGSWVKDMSSQITFVQFLNYSGVTYGVTKDGKLLRKSETVYKDYLTSYDMVVESKYFDLSKSFNFKKLKKLYVLARGYSDYDVEYKVKVLADSQIVLDPEVGYAYVDENDFSVWESSTQPNIEFHQASLLGEWVLGEDVLGGQELSVQKTRIRGKCRRVKIVFVNSQDQEVELFGFGLEFKLKKP